jgi:hypothetical protein
MDNALDQPEVGLTEPPPESPSRRGWAVAIPLVCALAGLALFAVPMYVIWPFRSQGARELAAALAIKQAGPWLSIGFAALAVAALASFWHAWRRGRRTVGIIFTVLAVSAIALTRFNMYERMFHPIGAPTAESASTAKVDLDDMVMVVSINGSARAYPIRTMGYHHIANDWVGGEPIVATY